ncbi:DUF1877 family protein [Streptomyces sp. NPDC006172]|uniref:DUF1877 family protein n=1 Tax=Streptomyces sp. NPDC006172 TaxID=3154470 RepID=UPI0033FDEE73
MNGEYLRVTPAELDRALKDPEWALDLAEEIQDAAGEARAGTDRPLSKPSRRWPFADTCVYCGCSRRDAGNGRLPSPHGERKQPLLRSAVRGCRWRGGAVRACCRR